MERANGDFFNCGCSEVSQGGQARGHAHHHGNVNDSTGARLLMTLGLNLLIPAVQIAGGIQARSMALISDAAHNFSDFTAVLIAYLANRIGRKGASAENTFGYRRAEILAAIVNVALLVGAAAYIVYEAMDRLRHTEAVSGGLVVLIGSVGILGNGLSALLLHRDAGHNLNVRGAFLHMLGDLLTSVVVVLNGLVLMFKPWYWLDPILSVLIALFILKNCWAILKEATRILMNATPSGLDIARIKTFLEQIPGISGVHYLHAWNLCSSSVAFSCHVVVPDQQLSDIDALAERIRHQLRHRFGIDHPVLQFETKPCGEGSLLCRVSCSTGGAVGTEPGTLAEKRRRASLLRKPLHFWVRVTLGVIFLAASVDKILHPAAFAQAVFNYQILPDSLINITALVLPWLEVVLGVLLIAGWWLPGALTLTNAFLIAFCGAAVYNVARGLDIHCGCFTTSTEGSPATTWYLLRDGIFLLMGAYVFYREIMGGSGGDPGRSSHALKPHSA
ncbi:MAG: cation diffusion facilitator family transporter [Deltaproteobacteria bacterium]|nr:cation diffusion facilitator family transporter [Deltaproteobacteria bacterium]